MVAGIVAARALGPDGYGSVVLAIAVVTLVTTLLDLSLEQAVVHYGYRAITAKDFGALRSLLRVAFAVDLGVGVAVGALILGLAGPLSDLLGSGEADASLVRIAVAISFVQTVDGTTGAVLLLAGRRELRAWAVFGTSVLRLIGVLWAVGVGGPEEVLIAYTGAALVGSLVQGVLAWRVGWSKWDRAEPREDARDWLAKLRSFGIFSSVSTSVQGAQRSAAPVILGSLAGAQAVGLFSVALFPLTVASLATAPLRLLLFPEQARQASEGDIEGLRTTIRGATRIGLAIGLPAAVAGWFLLPVILPAFYSGQFEDAIGPARILLIAAVVHLALAWSKMFLPAIGRPGLQTAYEVAFAVFLVAGIAVLGRFEATGAAIAVSFAYVATQVPLYFVANRLLDDAERVPPDKRAPGLRPGNLTAGY
jgi:O-antigen/teichoic acid export membrane protein